MRGRARGCVLNDERPCASLRKWNGIQRLQLQPQSVHRSHGRGLTLFSFTGNAHIQNADDGRHHRFHSAPSDSRIRFHPCVAKYVRFALSTRSAVDPRILPSVSIDTCAGRRPVKWKTVVRECGTPHPQSFIQPQIK